MSGAESLAPNPGSTHSRKRVGRGNGSGHGTYSGRGLKGQKARSGKKTAYASFQGGQFPLARKFHVLRGFNNKWRVPFQPINLGALERFDAGATVGPDELQAAGLLRHQREPVKILAEGELTRALNVHAHKFSKAAAEKIAAAGGTVTVIGPDPAAEEA